MTINPHVLGMGFNAGMVALGTVALTAAINPLYGATFGAINYVVTEVAKFAINQLNPHFVLQHRNTLNFGCAIFSTAATIGIAALTFTIVGIPFAWATLAVLTLALGVGLLIGEFAKFMLASCCEECCEIPPRELGLEPTYNCCKP